MRIRKLLIASAFIISAFQIITAQHSVARMWNEALLDAIRTDFARPTVHARNLYHTSVAMYDVWAAYDEQAQTFFLGKTLRSYTCPFEGVPAPADIQAARDEAISYAMYRLLKHRFRKSPGKDASYAIFRDLFVSLGYDSTMVSMDYLSGSPAALGNYIADQLILFGLQDGSNENFDYINLYYEPVNEPLIPVLPGNPDMTNPNRWQPLTLEIYIDQAGNIIPGPTPEFVSPYWGKVVPFALTSDELEIYPRDDTEYWVYHDPGAPPYLNTKEVGGLSEEYKWNHRLVSIWSSHLDPTDGVMIDISPASFGNNPVESYPTTIEGLRDFYNEFEGGDYGMGHDMNPHTGEPYEPNIVPRGDYARVLAEFWADGPDSETPPGHWFTILNYVVDHPEFTRHFMGEGPELDPLQFDVFAYFVLAGAVHDAAVTAWGIKGWYDYTRPISAIRFMADRGQSSDPDLPSYHPGGIPLDEGYVELVMEGDPLAGPQDENVGKIKVYAWRGPDYISNPDVDDAGVGWILAENWWPYQRPTFITPPFAGYISGHSTFSRAAAEVMTLITGDAFFPGGMGVFEAPRNEFLVFEEGPSVDVTLQWATYRDASDQTSLSRIWGGIHPPVDDIPGRLIGIQIGEEAVEYALCFLQGDDALPTASFGVVVEDSSVTLTNTSTNGKEYMWDFGDGSGNSEESPVHDYAAAGIYDIQLIASNRCGVDTVVVTVDLEPSAVRNTWLNKQFAISPNPNTGTFMFRSVDYQGTVDLEIFNVQGQLVHSVNDLSMSHSQMLRMPATTPGLYYAVARNAEIQAVVKFVVE